MCYRQLLNQSESSPSKVPINTFGNTIQLIYINRIYKRKILFYKDSMLAIISIHASCVARLHLYNNITILYI